VFTQRVKAIAKKFYYRFIKLKGAPRNIALGFSLGLFIGMTPFIGVHIITSVILASLLGWNKVSAIIGVNITNLGTAPLVYSLNYWVGLKLVGVSCDVAWSLPHDYSQMFEMVRQSPLIFIDLLIGGIILGVPLAIAGYFISLRTIQIFRKKNTKRSITLCKKIKKAS
jgi:uncharacterized protein (DUF2062 family)